MRLTRIYVDTQLQSGSIVELPRETAQHLAKVLRARSGDQLILFNGDGREFAGAIDGIRGSRVTAAVGESTNVDRESPLSVTLIQCIPRGDRMDFIVQKATELGVRRIVPVLSQRSVVAVSACEQCGRTRLPMLDTPTPLVNYLGDTTTTTHRLVLEPGVEPGDMPANLAGIVDIAIGPEGGFADEELEAFRLAGFAGVRLGPRILRTETAAIAALTWLQTRYGDMQTPG